MSKWIDRAKREIQKASCHTTVKTDETSVSAVTAVPQQSKSRILGATNLAATVEELPARAWVVEEVLDDETLRAVKICSAVLEDHLWLILDRGFEPKDGLAIYYPGELPFLKTKSLETLREIHKVKLKFPRCRVIQEGAKG